jgi:hypothetical protein
MSTFFKCGEGEDARASYLNCECVASQPVFLSFGYRNLFYREIDSMPTSYVLYCLTIVGENMV